MQLSSDDTGNLKEIISNETEEHQQLLQKVFKYISAEGRVPPTNLWEYTVSHSKVLSVSCYSEAYFTTSSIPLSYHWWM